MKIPSIVSTYIPTRTYWVSNYYFPLFPEPEIYLPPGTDLLVGLKDNVDLPGNSVPPQPLPRLPNDEQESVAEILDESPTRTLYDKEIPLRPT